MTINFNFSTNNQNYSIVNNDGETFVNNSLKLLLTNYQEYLDTNNITNFYLLPKHYKELEQTGTVIILADKWIGRKCHKESITIKTIQ